MQIACNPILINPSATFAANASVNTTVNLQSMDARAETVNVTVSLKLRTNASGKIVNYDISPILAALCRQYFIAQKYYDDTPPNKFYPYAQNQYQYTVNIQGTTVSADILLFAAGEVGEAQLLSGYLLRRNTSTIHIYEGLPGDFVLWNTITGWKVYDKEFNEVSIPGNNVESRYFAVRWENYIPNAGLGVGEYYFAKGIPFNDKKWHDYMTWNDGMTWHDDPDSVVAGAVVYPLVIHPDPSDCIRSGAKVYVRYWNSRGAFSYALLDVLYNDLKAKTEYADSWRLNTASDYGRCFGDRVQTEKEMTYTITAGRDGLDRLDVDELRDMQRAYCVQVWDIERQVWRDCYVQDATTRNNGGNGQEMTFTIEMPHEYTFTR